MLSTVNEISATDGGIENLKVYKVIHGKYFGLAFLAVLIMIYSCL